MIGHFLPSLEWNPAHFVLPVLGKLKTTGLDERKAMSTKNDGNNRADLDPSVRDVTRMETVATSSEADATSGNASVSVAALPSLKGLELVSISVPANGQVVPVELPVKISYVSP